MRFLMGMVSIGYSFSSEVFLYFSISSPPLLRYLRRLTASMPACSLTFDFESIRPRMSPSERPLPDASSTLVISFSCQDCSATSRSAAYSSAEWLYRSAMAASLSLSFLLVLPFLGRGGCWLFSSEIANSRSSLPCSTRYLALIVGKLSSFCFGLKVNMGTVQSPFSSSHLARWWSLYISFSVRRMPMTLLLNFTAFSCDRIIDNSSSFCC